jgi:hypothetical protein
MSEAEYDTPLMEAICHGSTERVRYEIRRMREVDGRDWINRNETDGMGITPLLTVCMRPDDDEALIVARILLENGADANFRDSGPGGFPLYQAARGGKTALVRLLLQSGADMMLTPRVDPTKTAFWIACEHGHAACAVEFLKAAEQQGLLKRLIEKTNSIGTTPCCVGAERGHAEIVGVLVKAGCDIRLASPAYYCIDNNPNCDPVPTPRAVQYPLDMSIRSHATLSCANCGATAPDLKQCGKCKLAYFCNRECQTKHWPLHKRCCSKLATGRDMYGDPAGPFPEPLNEPYGFQDAFCDSDYQYNGYSGNYVREEHAVWEYDAGPRGRPDWRRYPDDIEASMESLFKLGSPKYMYKPGDLAAEGQYEIPRTTIPAGPVATRHVSFYGLVTEREVYTGASRSVRRNGKRILHAVNVPAPREPSIRGGYR